MRENYYWLNQDSTEYLKRGYLLEGVEPIERIEQIAETLQQYHPNKKGLKESFIHNMQRGYYSLSSPIWSNFGMCDERNGLPISCFGSFIDDSIESMAEAHSECMMMSKFGGGTSSYWGKVRPRGAKIRGNGKSAGSFSFLPMFDTMINTVSQGSTRKGQMAAYQDVAHPDIHEWLNIHQEGNPIQLMTYGVCVGHDWLEEMKAGDPEKRAIWAKVLQSRTKTGLPYIFFKDNANNNKPDVYKDKDMVIHSSNLCAEIALPTSPTESFVCCLSSLNLENFDEWKDTDAVEVMVYFLDAVIEEFILKAKNVPFLHRAVKFAENHRAIGIGALGWHSYLQKNDIAFESFAAMQANAKIFAHIKEKAYAASEQMIKDGYAEPEVLKGYGRRNTTLTSVAPTKTSSFILGQVSLGIEPLESNYFVKDLAHVKTTYKNPYLKQKLAAYNKDNDATWLSILANNGSVQHLDFMNEKDKDIFKTFAEISQLTIIQQAAQRQQFIDQSQSINLKILPTVSVKDLNQLILTAEELGVKSLYYQYSVNAAQTAANNILECKSCEA